MHLRMCDQVFVLDVCQTFLNGGFPSLQTVIENPESSQILPGHLQLLKCKQDG